MRDLRRMRFFATALLALMSAIFVATYLVRYQWPWLPYLRAFAEAGNDRGLRRLVRGRCAVPPSARPADSAYRDRPAQQGAHRRRASAASSRNNFLSPKVLSAKLREIDTAGWIARWLSDPANAHRVAGARRGVVPQILRALPRDEVNAFLTRAVRHGIEAVPAAPLASQLLSLFWAQGETQALVEKAISIAAAALTDNRDVIKATVTQKSSRFIPKWVDAIVADKIMSGLTQLLDEMRNPAHPWRVELGSQRSRS